MAATQQQREQPSKDLERHKREALNDLIGAKLIQALGSPGALLQVQVRPLWDDHYRVNVFVGADVVSGKVAHSFFLTADGGGNIIQSTPKITRRYSAVAREATSLGGKEA